MTGPTFNAGRWRSRTARGRADTIVPGVQRAPTPAWSNTCGTRKPRQGPAFRSRTYCLDMATRSRSSGSMKWSWSSSPRSICTQLISPQSRSTEDPKIKCQAYSRIRICSHGSPTYRSLRRDSPNPTASKRLLVRLPEWDTFVRIALDDVIATARTSPMVLQHLHHVLEEQVREHARHRTDATPSPTGCPVSTRS